MVCLQYNPPLTYVNVPLSLTGVSNPARLMGTIDVAEACGIERVHLEMGLFCLEACASRFDSVQARVVEIAHCGVLGVLWRRLLTL